jgi:hypothetical protein
MESPRFNQEVTLAFIVEIKKLEIRHEDLAREMRWVRENLVTASSPSKDILASEIPALKAKLARLTTALDETWGATESLRTFANISWDDVWE